MSDSIIRETCLASVHREQGGTMVEFGGWNMPLHYTGIREEHLRTRTACSLFDVSHMGRLKFNGPDAIAAVERLCPARVTLLEEGQSHYSFLLDDSGGAIDDLLITRDLDGIGMVVNASNRIGDLEWMQSHISDLDTRIMDMTEETAMIAVQGPKAAEIVRKVTGGDLTQLPYYQARVDMICGTLGIVSRTGYTGEDGYELTVPATVGPRVWNELLAAGGDQIGPAGLGARDTLRLEAAMPLYGHELTREVSPIEAGLKRFVDLENSSFIGHKASVKLASSPRQKLVCIKGEGRKVPREGADLMQDGAKVGRITSGTYSPTFAAPIAMGLVLPTVPAGATLMAEVRGKQVPMTIVKRPFYKRGTE